MNKPWAIIQKIGYKETVTQSEPIEVCLYLIGNEQYKLFCNTLMNNWLQEFAGE